MKRTLITLLSALSLALAVPAQAVIALDSTGVAPGQRINAASDTTCLQVAPNGMTQQVIVMVGKPATIPSHPVVRQTPAKPVVSKPDTTNVRVLLGPVFPTLPWSAWVLLALVLIAALVAAVRDRDVNVTNNNNLECPGCECDCTHPEPQVTRTLAGIHIDIPPDAYGRDLELTLKINGPNPPNPPTA